MRDSKGWDGKLRVGERAIITNPEALEDSDYSDPEAPPVDEIEADEGTYGLTGLLTDSANAFNALDLLEDEDPDADVYPPNYLLTTMDEFKLTDRVRISTSSTAAYDLFPRYDWSGSRSYRYV